MKNDTQTINFLLEIDIVSSRTAKYRYQENINLIATGILK
jgi:hypothetical protein